MSQNKKTISAARHYPDGQRLRDNQGRLWLPKGSEGSFYFRDDEQGAAMHFNKLASQHGPMIKEPADG